MREFLTTRGDSGHKRGRAGYLESAYARVDVSLAKTPRQRSPVIFIRKAAIGGALSTKPGSPEEVDEEQDPEVLYHYTTQGGMLGIIESASLWATKVQYFNDSAEYHLTLRLAEKLVNEFARDGRHGIHSDGDRDVLLSEIKSTEQANVFVISLSALSDSLSQWRAYGSPSSAFAIGFRRADLKVIAEAIDWQLFKCVYVPEEHRRLVGQAIKTAMESSPIENAGRILRAQLTALAPRMKHHSFEEEDERRIVSPLLPEQFGFNFRLGRFTPLPYVSLPTTRFDKAHRQSRKSS